MNPGNIVLILDGSERIGRTYDRKGTVNGKTPVYLTTEIIAGCPTKYSDKGILIKEDKLKIIGFID
jgi:hypothetical protein